MLPWVGRRAVARRCPVGARRWGVVCCPARWYRTILLRLYRLHAWWHGTVLLCSLHATWNMAVIAVHCRGGCWVSAACRRELPRRLLLCPLLLLLLRVAGGSPLRRLTPLLLRLLWRVLRLASYGARRLLGPLLLCLLLGSSNSGSLWRLLSPTGTGWRLLLARRCILRLLAPPRALLRRLLLLLICR